MPDDVIGYIDYIRLLIEAINSGRIEAKTIAGMSDEQISDYLKRLQTETAAEVERGREVDPG
jgi:hypothetical protein